MRQFSGLEPLVGEVVGLRTFRVDESGLLLPLFSGLAWYDGPNTAQCAPPTGDRTRLHYQIPDPDCECGFYAYGTEQAANRNRQARYVQAVVSCWGGVVAGTQGVRAEHARIEALWFNPTVPTWVRRRVASRYPSARVYSDQAAMLQAHPLSALPCYEAPPARRLMPRFASSVAAIGLLVLGVLPMGLLHSMQPLWAVWLGTVIAVSTLLAWLLLSSTATGHRAAAFVTGGVLAWLIAPLFGVPGWLLRLPLLRGMLVAAGGYLLSLRPGFFPIEHGPRERAFCGVRT